MHDAARNTLAACDSIIDGCYCELRLHPRGNRVTDDAIRIDVFDCTDVEFPLTGGVLGDIGEPDLVHPRGREIAPDKIIVHGRAGLLVITASFFAKHAPPLVF